jgi:hypothetical protein
LYSRAFALEGRGDDNTPLFRDVLSCYIRAKKSLITLIIPHKIGVSAGISALLEFHHCGRAAVHEGLKRGSARSLASLTKRA